MVVRSITEQYFVVPGGVFLVRSSTGYFFGSTEYSTLLFLVVRGNPLKYFVVTVL